MEGRYLRTSLMRTAAAQAVENEFEAGTLERPPPLVPYQVRAAAADDEEEQIADGALADGNAAKRTEGARRKK